MREGGLLTLRGISAWLGHKPAEGRDGAALREGHAGRRGHDVIPKAVPAGAARAVPPLPVGRKPGVQAIGPAEVGNWPNPITKEPTKNGVRGWEGRDLNPYESYPTGTLKPARLPIPPPSQRPRERLEHTRIVAVLRVGSRSLFVQRSGTGVQPRGSDCSADPDRGRSPGSSCFARASRWLRPARRSANSTTWSPWTSFCSTQSAVRVVVSVGAGGLLAWADALRAKERERGDRSKRERSAYVRYAQKP